MTPNREQHQPTDPHATTWRRVSVVSGEPSLQLRALGEVELGTGQGVGERLVGPVDRQCAPLPGRPQPQRPRLRARSPSAPVTARRSSSRVSTTTHGIAAPQARSQTAVRNPVSIRAKWASSTRPVERRQEARHGILEGDAAREPVVGEPVHGGALPDAGRTTRVAHDHPAGPAEQDPTAVDRQPADGQHPVAARVEPGRLDVDRQQGAGRPAGSRGPARRRRGSRAAGPGAAVRSARSRRCSALRRNRFTRCTASGSGAPAPTAPRARSRTPRAGVACRSWTARRARRSCRSARRRAPGPPGGAAGRTR